MAVPSFLMALAAVWVYAGFRDFSLQRLIQSTREIASSVKVPTSLGLCMIKGDIDDQDHRIYQVPGGVYYDLIVIEVSRGERWLCTEAEARAAGWRKSKL